MKQITKIEIHRFRGIKDLILNDLKPVTLFLGENSVGKSSVLESLFMATGPSNPFVPIWVNSKRAHGPIRIDDIYYLFYDCDLSQSPYFEATLNTNERRWISLYPDYSIEETSNMGHLSSVGNNNHHISGINCKFRISNEKEEYSGESSLVRSQNGKFAPNIDTHYKESIVSVSLSSFYATGSLNDEYDSLVRAGKKDIILKALNRFDDRITAIEATKDGLFIAYKHLQNMVPLGMAGDGIQKYLGIAVCAYQPTTDIIIIDEIENGLHFSAHIKLWECILETAKDLGKQFFVSTHNKETLRCLSSLVGQSEDYSRILNVITLTRKEDSIEPYYLSGLGLMGAIDKDIEIRK